MEMSLPAITLDGQRESWRICGLAAELFGWQYARRLGATGVEAVSFELGGDLNLRRLWWCGRTCTPSAQIDTQLQDEEGDRDMLLGNKNAVICGAVGAVGSAAAFALAGECLAVSDRSHGRAVEAVVEEIVAVGGIAEAVPCTRPRRARSRLAWLVLSTRPSRWTVP